MTIMAHPALSIGIEAQNLFKVLSLIDRTILPRRLFLANDTAELVLVVARQRASLEGRQTEADAATAKGLANAIARLCTFGHSVTHRLETASPRRSAVTLPRPLWWGSRSIAGVSNSRSKTGC